jgi:cobalamin-dependent methionine synthase I
MGNDPPSYIRARGESILLHQYAFPPFNGCADPNVIEFGKQAEEDDDYEVDDAR